MNIDETCPVSENEKFKIRLIKNEDCDDLLKVYSDKMALPFFNLSKYSSYIKTSVIVVNKVITTTTEVH